MPTTVTKICVCATLLIAHFLLKATDSVAADAPQVKSEAPNAKLAPSGQVFELRIYTAAPGKMDLLNKRFREHTLRLFEKHGIKSVGYWTEADKQKEERLYYLVAYPDRKSRDKMLVNGIAADPEFLKIVAESEKEGKLTTKIESVILTPTDYSPLR
jgi:hypothetical protein